MNKQIVLKPFQTNAVEALRDDVLHRWKRDTRQEVKFQSPTGSGKTVMMAQFVRDMVNAPELSNADFAFLWASIGGSKEGDLASQSRNKFITYYGGASEVQVTGLDSLNREKVLEKGEILFFNWSKIRVRNKEGRRLRRDNEREVTWDGMVQRTHEAERNIILVIDEAHAESVTPLTEKEIQLINPKIVIRVTATHRDRGDIDVHIAHDDVVQSGLIKQSIRSQTKEDFESKEVENLDKYILELALKKREDLYDLYKKNDLYVNPLLVIQLPNDDTVNQEEETKKDIVLGHLKELKVDNGKIAIWLDREHVNLEHVTENTDEVEVLLFKLAASTGWDCPRAQVLLMYREILGTTFKAQVLGRVLRMPEGRHYEEPDLNHSYLYTSYEKSDIIRSYENHQEENQTVLFHSSVRKGVEQMRMKTFVSQRTVYNDLGKTFQFTFIKVADKMLNEKERKVLRSCCKSGEGVETNLIIDHRIRDYDGFVDFIKEADSLGERMSPNDVEKLYKKLCIEILHKQESETKFGNIARSYGKLKSAINVWFEKSLGVKDKNKYYPCIVNDLNKDSNSVLLPVINEALREYVSVRSKEEEEKDKRKVKMRDVSIPAHTTSYTSDYEKIEGKKCAVSPCYVSRNNQNEKRFVDYLEGNQQVEWWYKNGDNGSEHFSVKRDNGSLFFPDWFVKTKKGVWIVDTKGGFTAEGEGAVSRAKALDGWLKKNKKFKGGLIKKVAGVWKVAEDVDLKKWVKLDFSQ